MAQQPHALVIDDNALNVKVMSQLLHKQGVMVTDVQNPNSLESFLPQLGPVDIIFVDLEMPGLDGYSVKEMIRAYNISSPIIAYTVHVSEINEVRKSGFDGFLGKPLDGTRFPGQLDRILRGESVWEWER
ncbi:response regulator [Phototrophicus methaneseepsis]|uniref:Response regulator n=1 Tax=Phototrophicus methaneseepsis TaxID=2710758 RepID=A0A7S8EBR6_9CHLR|nr:response regulator [Phototrophicus methaneseepsis]QPC84009.1 response regulator [Phototrophicus methaneseepsis]